MIEQRDFGFIKLKRTILEWEWYHDNNTFRVMIHLLLKSNYTVKQWQGNTINPGELITSIGNLGRELNLSESNIRTCLKKLKKTNYISTQGTSKYTKVKITNSIIYDCISITDNEQINKPSSNKQLSINEQITTTNKANKEKENKESIEDFKNQIFQFSNFYSLEHLNGFYDYWNSINKKTGHRKFEDNKYWDLEDRLKNWKVLNSKKEEQSFTKNR